MAFEEKIEEGIEAFSWFISEIIYCFNEYVKEIGFKLENNKKLYFKKIIPLPEALNYKGYIQKVIGFLDFQISYLDKNKINSYFEAVKNEFFTKDDFCDVEFSINYMRPNNLIRIKSDVIDISKLTGISNQIMIMPFSFYYVENVNLVSKKLIQIELRSYEKKPLVKRRKYDEKEDEACLIF